MSSVTPRQSDGNHPQPHLPVVMSAHDNIIGRLAYLPDGRRIVTVSRARTVKVWNLEIWEQKGTSMEHESGIFGLAVTRDGTTIISSDDDGIITVWNVESHEIVKEWTHPESWPEIAISPCDRLIAVASGNRAVTIYTMEGRQVNHSIEVHENVLSMCFSPDGKRLACGTHDDIRVSVAHSPFKVHYGATKFGSIACCGHATAAGSSLARRTQRFAVGTPIQENKSDIRGQVTPAI